MKPFLTILFSFILLTVQARKVYFDPTNGTTGAGTQLNPYRNLQTANAALLPNDTLMWAQGTTTYTGSIAPNGIFFDATAKAGVTILAYYNGISTAKPIWTGLKTISSGSWVAKGGNYFGYTDSEFGTYLNEFVLNGKPMPMMRNEASPSNPYHRIDTATTSYIVDTSLTGAEGYAGYQIVFRGIQWNNVKVRCTQQRVDTLFYTFLAGQKASLGYPPKKGFGYFIQNKPSTAEALGEWYFDSLHKQVVAYFPNGNPSAYVCQVPIATVALNSSASGVKVEGMDFRGFLLEAYTGAGDSLKWTNCEFSLMGVASHYVTDRQAHEFWYCNFYDNQNTTIKATSANYLVTGGNKNWKIIGCSFLRTGVVGEGMGYGNGDPMFDALVVVGDNIIMQGNYVDGTGYNGYHIQSVGFLAEYNFGTNTNKYLSDGAVFYNFYGNSVKPSSPAKSIIRYCIFINPIGNSQGVGVSSFNPTDDNGKAGCVYMDENSSNVEMYGNTLWGAPWGAIVLNGAHGQNIHDNNIGGSWRLLVCSDFNSNGLYASDNIRFVSNTTSQSVMNVNFPPAPGAMLIDFHNLIQRTPTTILYSDSNQYNVQSSVSGNIVYRQYLSAYASLTFPQWLGYVKSDSNSTITQRTAHKLLYNRTGEDVYQSVAGSWKNSGGATVSENVLVPAYGSVILFDSTAGLTPPTPRRLRYAGKTLVDTSGGRVRVLIKTQ